MSKRAFLSVATCALLGGATVCNVPAQTGGGPVPTGRAAGGFQQMPAGPPAPVPPEVAVARPTPEEVDKLNADLKRFIATSPDRELLQKYEALIRVQMPRDNSAIRPAGRGGRQHESFVKIAETGDFDILFLGDSITYLWTVGDGDISGYPGGKTVFEKYFANLKIANFGIPGDTTQGVLWRLQNGEGQGHKPKAVMLMIGTNNNGNTPEEIAEGVGADVLELRKDFPDAKILLLAIFPRGTGSNDPGRLKMEAVNKIIARLDDQKHVFFVNLNNKFLDANGGLIGFRPTDHLHPLPEGYEIWAASVAPVLKGWIN